MVLTYTHHFMNVPSLQMDFFIFFIEGLDVPTPALEEVAPLHCPDYASLHLNEYPWYASSSTPQQLIIPNSVCYYSKVLSNDNVIIHHTKPFKFYNV